MIHCLFLSFTSSLHLWPKTKIMKPKWLVRQTWKMFIDKREMRYAYVSNKNVMSETMGAKGNEEIKWNFDNILMCLQQCTSFLCTAICRFVFLLGKRYLAFQRDSWTDERCQDRLAHESLRTNNKWYIKYNRWDSLSKNYFDYALSFAHLNANRFHLHCVNSPKQYTALCVCSILLLFLSFFL